MFFLTGVYSSAVYKELIGKIEFFNSILCMSMNISMRLLNLITLPYTLVSFFIFNMGADSFNLFWPSWFVLYHKMECNTEIFAKSFIFSSVEHRYPFNVKTVPGYLVAVLAQWVGTTAVARIFIQFSNLFIGSCWLFIVIAEDITQEVAAFNILVKTSSDENRAEITKCFCDTVRIYSDAKQ